MTAQPAQPEQPDTLMTRKEVAAVLHVNPRTLTRWSTEGIGPQPLTLAPRVVRYRASDVQAFIEAQAHAGTQQS